MPCRRPTFLLLSCVSLGACSMPNPEFASATETGTTNASLGDGDGAPGDGDGSPGDGDGSPGDGDGTPGDGDGSSCGDEQLLCDGICVGPDDNNNCGSCGMVCPTKHICHFGACLPKKIVFVTSEVTQGDLLGIGSADLRCNELAMSAQLPGTYLAWLSSPNESPADRFVSEGVFVLTSGPVVAWSWADLTDGNLEHSIDATELGELPQDSPACDNSIVHAVWTGTNFAGMTYGPDCNGWTSADSNTQGRVGNLDVIDDVWSGSDCLVPCTEHHPFYCVQQ